MSGVSFAEARGSKNRCFSASHPTVMADYPAFIQRQYEELLVAMHRGALDRVLLHLVQGLVVAGVAFALCSRLIKESHALQFYACKETYYLYHEALQKSERSSIRSFFKPVNPATATPSESLGAAQPGGVARIPILVTLSQGQGIVGIFRAQGIWQPYIWQSSRAGGSGFTGSWRTLMGSTSSSIIQVFNVRKEQPG